MAMQIDETVFTAMTALLRADTEAALASIAQTRALATRFGLDLEPPKPPSVKRAPMVSGSKGKSKPNLAGWLRRATEDGTLPAPTDVLIISPRMVRQGLAAGYITGSGHPYCATASGLRYATTGFKGKRIQRG
jgi:hypothetical protein